MKKTIAIIIAGLCVLPILAAGANFNTSERMQKNNHASLLEGGWVEQRDGLTILHVNGSHYQMGY